MAATTNKDEAHQCIFFFFSSLHIHRDPMHHPYPSHSDEPPPIHSPQSINHSPNPNSPTPLSLSFLLPPHAFMVLFPFSPLHRRQTRYPFPSKLFYQLTRRAGKLCPLQFHHRPNPSFHGLYRTHPLQNLMCLRFGFQILSET